MSVTTVVTSGVLRRRLEVSPWKSLLPQLTERATQQAPETIEREVAGTVGNLAAATREVRPRADDGDDLISVVVTLFNAAEHVASCVASLLAQTHPALEVILVDDCSSDGTFEVAAAIAREHPCVTALRARRNAGTYVAKNLGLTHARGRYVSFQDCDDVSHPDRLSTQLAALRAGDLVATSCHYARIDEDTGELLLNRGERSRAGLISLLLDWPRVRDAVGFFDSVRVNADDEFKTRIKLAFGPRAVGELPACHYYALLRAEGLTVSGHTANDIGSRELGRFLAPVRQRYTASFQAWHRESANARLAIEFPSVRRPFPAPVSIDPFHGARFAENAIAIGASEAASLASVLAQRADLGRFFGRVLLIEGEAGAGEGPAFDAMPMSRLALQSTSDKTFKEMADVLGGGAVLIVERAADLLRLDGARLRRALYALMSRRPAAAAVAFHDVPALYLPLEALDVSRTRFVAGADLMRSAALTALAFGAELEFQ